jgi:hypothetical protein
LERAVEVHMPVHQHLFCELRYFREMYLEGPPCWEKILDKRSPAVILVAASLRAWSILVASSPGSCDTYIFKKYPERESSP